MYIPGGAGFQPSTAVWVGITIITKPTWICYENAWKTFQPNIFSQMVQNGNLSWYNP